MLTAPGSAQVSDGWPEAREAICLNLFSAVFLAASLETGLVRHFEPGYRLYPGCLSLSLSGGKGQP